MKKYNIVFEVWESCLAPYYLKYLSSHDFGSIIILTLDPSFFYMFV